MDDYRPQIEDFQEIFKVNISIALLFFSFLLGVIIWAFPQADTKGEKILLIYMLANIITLALLVFLNSRKYLKKIIPENSKEFLTSFISDHLSQNDLIPFIFFIPIFLSFGGIWAIDISHDRDPEEWIYAISIIAWIYSLYMWKKTRNKLLNKYKDLTNGPYFSLFSF